MGGSIKKGKATFPRPDVLYNRGERQPKDNRKGSNG